MMAAATLSLYDPTPQLSERLLIIGREGEKGGKGKWGKAALLRSPEGSTLLGFFISLLPPKREVNVEGPFHVLAASPNGNKGEKGRLPASSISSLVEVGEEKKRRKDRTSIWANYQRYFQGHGKKGFSHWAMAPMLAHRLRLDGGNDYSQQHFRVLDTDRMIPHGGVQRKKKKGKKEGSTDTGVRD